MSILKLKKDIELLEKQLKEIDPKISDPIERIEQKKQLEKKIRKLKQSQSQREQLEKEQQELEFLKSEFSSSINESVNKKKSEPYKLVEYSPNIIDNSIATEFEANLNEQVEKSNRKKAKIKESSSAISSSQPIHTAHTSNNSNKSATARIKIKLIVILGLIIGTFVTIASIINFKIINSNSTQKVEETRLKELAIQAAIQAREEAEKARQTAIQAREQAEKARQTAIRAKEEAREQLEAKKNYIDDTSTSLSYKNSSRNKEINYRNSLTIDDLADRTFYSRHPELRGRKIRANETFLKQEWMQIRRCEAVVDYIFYQRHSELRERKILPGEKTLAREWLEIKRNVDECKY